jgi:dolichol-phosphate mannosyltransferase
VNAGRTPGRGRALDGQPVLVVGGTGFIGRHVCHAARAAGAEVTAVHRNAVAPDAGVGGVRYVARDLLSDSLDDLTSHETAIWCAGNSDHRAAWADPARDLSSSAVMLARVLEAFRGRLVLVSSGAVYHGLRGPVGPSSPVAPRHPYGVSRLAAEQLALSRLAGGRLSSLVILRLFHPFGPGERPNRIVPTLLHRFVTEGRTDFQLRGDGTTLMDVQPVESVAGAIVTAATVDAAGLVVDVCRGDRKRLIDVVQEVAAALQIEPEVSTDEATSEEPVEFYADPELGRSLLGLPRDEDLGPAIRSYSRLFRRPEKSAEPEAASVSVAEEPQHAAAGPQPDVSLIIPCLNEDQNVGGLVDKLARITDEAALRAEILIVDDCSDDYTFREALILAMRNEGVVALHKGLPRGIGNAIRFGLDHATGKVGVIVMGDNVDPLGAIPDFHRLIAKDGYDLVLLNRHANPEHRKSVPLWPYRVYQAIYRTLARLGMGLPYRDPTYAYRAFSVEFLRSLELESGGFEISPEITFKSWLHDARIAELTGAQGRRVAGASNFVFSQQALGFLRVLVKATLARRFFWLRRHRRGAWVWTRERDDGARDRSPAAVGPRVRA